MDTRKVALIGEYSPDVKAHRAIPIALEMASEDTGCEVVAEWAPTSEVEGNAEQRMSGYDALWCVPGSPFASFEGALDAIRYARETGVPFLGTCGGFQHALIEYARNVLGIREADHAESNPDASILFISPLVCSLVNTKGIVRLKDGSRIREIYGRSEVEEEYSCSFGLNPEYRSLLEKGEMRITAVDENDEVRVVELAGHPFFIGTLYQPERAALAGIKHPLIKAFAEVVRDTRVVVSQP
jgi:CTP synthase (UTP-ammonia lyase)